jgi:hypothetical protein
VTLAINADSAVAEATGFDVTWISYRACLLGAVTATYNPERDAQAPGSVGNMRGRGSS